MSSGTAGQAARGTWQQGQAQVLQQPQLAQGKPGQLFLRAAQPLDGGGGGDDQATPSAKAETGGWSGPDLTPPAGVVPDRDN